MNQKNLRLAVTAVAVAVAVTGCGDNPKPAAAPTSSAAATATPTPTAAPTASPTPTVDPDSPLKLGKATTLPDRYVTATVYGYRHNVAKSAPRPDEQPGYVWAAADVKVCAAKSIPAGTSVGVSNGPWSLVYADDTQIGASQTGYEAFPKPEYPWTEKALAPGRCVRGWITFPVPGKGRPAFVEYAPEGVSAGPRWRVG